jgi:hypothetical protein
MGIEDRKGKAMDQRRTCLSLAMALALAATGALAAEAEHEQHHPGTAPPAAAVSPAPSSPGTPMGSMPGGSGNMPMGMGMMGGMQQGGQQQAIAPQQGVMPPMCMMGMGQTAQAGGMQPMSMMGQNGMAGHIEGRIAFLKAELKITDAQQPLWNAVADAVRANAKDMAGLPQGTAMMGGSANLADRLAAHEKAMAAHLDGLRKLRTAFDPLYTSLSADQKKAADSLMIGPMGVMGMGMM